MSTASCRVVGPHLTAPAGSLAAPASSCRCASSRGCSAGHSLLVAHARYFVDDYHFRFRPAQRFRLLAREEHAHCAIWPFQPSPRRHPTWPRIAAASREDTGLAFNIDVVKVRRGWSNEMDALYASAHRGM